MMDTEDFISAVFLKPAIWDQKDPNHHNKFILDKLWQEISKQFNTTMPVVRNKWKGLRDKYRTTLTSISKPKSGSAQLADYNGSWQYFHNLSFLKDQFTARKSASNLPAIVEDESMNSLMDEILNDDESEMQNSISKETREIEAPSFSRQPLNSSPKPGKVKRSQEGIGNALLEMETEKLRFLQKKMRMMKIFLFFKVYCLI